EQPRGPIGHPDIGRVGHRRLLEPDRPALDDRSRRIDCPAPPRRIKGNRESGRIRPHRGWPPLPSPALIASSVGYTGRPRSRVRGGGSATGARLDRVSPRSRPIRARGVVVADEDTGLGPHPQMLQLAELLDFIEDVVAWVKDRAGRYRWVNRA